MMKPGRGLSSEAAGRSNVDPSGGGDQAQGFGGRDNARAVVLTDRQQVAIAGDQKISLGSHAGGNDMIVVNVRHDDAWRRRGHHEVRRRKVVGNHLKRRPVQ